MSRGTVVLFFFFHFLSFQRYRGFVRITYNTITNYMAWQEARGVQDELLRILEAHGIAEVLP